MHVIMQLVRAEICLRTDLVIWDKAWCFIPCAGSSHSIWLQQQVLKDYPLHGDWENSVCSTIRLPESQTCVREELSEVC